MFDPDHGPDSLPRKKHARARVHPVDVEDPARAAPSGLQPSLAQNVAHSVPSATAPFTFVGGGSASPPARRLSTAAAAAASSASPFRFAPPSAVSLPTDLPAFSMGVGGSTHTRRSSFSSSTAQAAAASTRSPRRGLHSLGLGQRTPGGRSSAGGTPRSPVDDDDDKSSNDPLLSPSSPSSPSHFPNSARSGDSCLPRVLGVLLLLALAGGVFFLGARAGVEVRSVLSGYGVSTATWFGSSSPAPAPSVDATAPDALSPLPLPPHVRARSAADGGEVLDVNELVDTTQGQLKQKPGAGRFGRTAEGRANANAAVGAGSPSGFHLLLRILSSGSHFHLELDRLLRSLTQARYASFEGAGVDRIDVEVFVDYPRGLWLPDSTAEQEQEEEAAEEAETDDPDRLVQSILLNTPAHRAALAANRTRARAERLKDLLHSPSFQSLKFEHDLTLLRAEEFLHSWEQTGMGHAWVRAISAEKAPTQGGMFNAFMRWEPKRHGRGHGRGQGHEWALVLRDTQELSPLWFEAVKQIVRTQFDEVGTNASSTPEAASTASTPPTPLALDPSVLFGVLLEPTETVLGVPLDTSKSFYPSLSPEKLLLPHLGGLDPSATPLLFGAQTLLPATGSGGPQLVLGGLLLRGDRFGDFKRWVRGQGLLQPDPGNERVDQADPGAPVLQVYARANLAGEPCVPGMVSNAWMGELVETFPEGLTEDEKVKAKAKPKTKERTSVVETVRRARMEGPWFTLGLLHRFMYERGLFALQWLPPSGSRLSLLSSSAYSIPHVHALGEAKDHAEHHHEGEGESHSDAQEQELEVHAHALTDLRSLPPLRRPLLQPTDPHGAMWSAQQAAPKVVVLPTLFDFAFQPVDASKAKAAQVSLVPIPAATACAQSVPGAPSHPPSMPLAPPDVLDRLAREVREREERAERLRAEARAQALERGEEVDTTPDPKLSELEDQAKKLSPLALQLAGLASDSKSHAGAGAGGGGALTPEQLVRFARGTLDAYAPNVSLCAYSSGSRANTDPVDGLPALDFWATEGEGVVRLVDPEELTENTTEVSQACWEEFDADFQLALLSPSLSPALAARARRRHADTFAQLQASQEHIRAEVAKKELFETLRVQVELVEEQIQEERDARLQREWEEARRRGQDKETQKGDKKKPKPSKRQEGDPPDALDELLAQKRRTGKGKIESEEEYERLLVAIKERKANKQHEPLYLG